MENPNNFIGPRPRGYFSFKTLLGQIIGSGSTPHYLLIKRFAWLLIAMVVLPPLLHDAVDLCTPLTPEQQKSVDRERRRILYKLRHAIGGWRIRDAPVGDDPGAKATRAFVDAFRADFAAHWSGEGRSRSRKTGVDERRVTSKHIEQSLREVLDFDARSDDAVAGAFILADALQDELVSITAATVEQRDITYADGHELHESLRRAAYCIQILRGYAGCSIRRPFSRLKSSERRATASLAIAMLQQRCREAASVRRLIAREDRRKMLALLMLGKRHFPFIIMHIFFNIASGSIQTMFRWQNAEGVLLTRLLGISLTKTSNHLDKHGQLKMSVALKTAIYSKMMSQDMSHFEQKFKRKDQARVMLNYYLQEKIMRRVERTLWRVRDLSRLVSGFAMLWRTSPRFLVMNLSFLPIRVGYGELMNWLSVKNSQRLMDTQNYDVTALLGTLDSRASFAATRLTGMEKLQQEKFDVVMSLYERLQMKGRTIQNFNYPIINVLRQLGEMVGYFFGAFEILNGTLSPADMMTFVNESASLITSLRRFTQHFSQAYMDRRDSLFIARFNGVEPTIGLSGKRPDGFEYIIPKMPPSEFIWTIECRNVTFWYPSDPEQKKIFSNLNLTIPPGKAVGICGRTGCGKSTLLRLFARLYDVQHGEILLNGRDLRDYEPQWLRENMAFVTSVKDTYLFSATVRENIEFGVGSGLDPDMKEEDRILLVEQAAERAQLVETVRQMPNGFNTMIGDRSEENLSDGQTQRLSLARGFLKDAEAMLMDEPTSALDPIVEARVVAAVNKWLKRDGRARTGIIVAHRLSTIRSCDRILYLAKTNPGDAKSSADLAEEGTHEQLIAMGGQYAAFATQLDNNISDSVAATSHSKLAAPLLPPPRPAAAAAAAAAAVAAAAEFAGTGGAASTDEAPAPVDEQVDAQLQSVLALVKKHTGDSEGDGHNTTGLRDRHSQSIQLTTAELEAAVNLRRTLEQIECDTLRPLQ